MSSPFFSKYLSDIGNISLLTPNREAGLGRAVQLGLCAGSTPTEKEAAEEAKQELVCRNLRLVVGIANSFLSSGRTLEELTFDGNSGLIQAAGRYDPDGFKTRFSTYAAFWIWEAIRHGIRSDHTVRMPARRAQQLWKIRACRSFLEGSREQDFGQLQEESGISGKRIAQLLSESFTVFSLNGAPNGEVTDDVQDLCSLQPPHTTSTNKGSRFVTDASSAACDND